MNERETSLLYGYLDQRLTADELAELQHQLRDRPEMAETLVEWCVDEACIAAWAKSSAPSVQLPRERWLEECRELEPSPTPRRRFRRRWLASVALAITLLAVAVGGWWASLPPSLGRITATTDAQGLGGGLFWWTVREGRSLRFDEGVVEISLNQGVRLVLEGPCECRLESGQRVRLGLGRLFAEVPAAGRGFAVLTPDGEIVDLGTRFGVEVAKERATELHVFDGLVTAALDESDAKAIEIRTGKAVALDARTESIKPIGLSHKFAEQATPYVEHFAYHGGSLAGKGEWIDSGFLGDPIALHPRGLNYPGLAGGKGDSLQVNAASKLNSPVGRRWHHPFFSALVRLDDDFSKSMHAGKHAGASLLSFAADDRATPVRLLAVAPDAPQAFRLGIASERNKEFCETRLSHTGVHLVVVAFDDAQIRLWVDPDAATFGARRAPRPDIAVPCVAGAKPEWLWIGDTYNPKFAWFWIDEIRGGNRWADVTPRRE